MALIPEVIDKIKEEIHDTFETVSDKVKEIFGDEATDESPVILADIFHGTFIKAPATSYYTNTMMNFFAWVTYDIDIKDNVATFKNQKYIGHSNETTWWTDAHVEEFKEGFYSANEFISKDDADGKIIVRISNDSVISEYYNNTWYNARIKAHWGNADSYYHQHTSSGLVFKNNQAEYTIDANDIVTCNINRSLVETAEYLYGLKGYPIVGNCNDTTYINNFISNQGADNNYTHTYTTPQGKNINVYYGDNYVITHVENNEPVTYKDLENAFNIAVNQINEDNDTDIEVPTYKDLNPDPEPITDDDYIDMGLGVETDGMAMYNMAVVTRQELFDLITDFEANADTGLSFIPHVLGLYKLGFESSMLVSEFTNDKIRLHKEPQKTAFNSAANYNIVKTQEVVIDCGSITVDREELLTTTFLDFSPYSTYEMFIPGCGWITLPDTIVGRTISVAIVFDLTTCSCKGVVRSESSLLGGSGTTLATVNGIIGSSVPLSINETGLQRAAIMNGSTQAAMALGTAFMGVGIGNPYMGASGIAMAAGALASNHIAGNSTYTSTKGGATDYSVFGDGWKAVLKITRPVLEIPDNYGHSVGFVVNRYDTLSNFSGFTVCVNPHIHISATSDEKEEIKRLLEEGVILPEGE